MNKQLEDLNLIVKTGAIIDASVIESSRRPRKVMTEVPEDRKEEENTTEFEVEYSKDTDAKWLKKGNKSTYGYKIHNAVDDKGFILGGTVTPANVSNMREFENVLKEINLEKNSRVMADKGYCYESCKETLRKLGLNNFIMEKKVKNQEMSAFDKARNKAISKVRFVVERTFGGLKLHFEFTRARYVGIEKLVMEYRIKSIAFNIKKAVGILC